MSGMQQNILSEHLKPLDATMPISIHIAWVMAVMANEIQ